MEVFTVETSGNGDSLFNATSISLRGDESLSFLLRLLVAGELFFNADYYAEHWCLKKVLLTPDTLRILYFQCYFNVKQNTHFL